MVGNQAFNNAGIIDNSADGFAARLFVKVADRKAQQLEPHALPQGSDHFLPGVRKKIGRKPVADRLNDKNERKDSR